MQPLRKQIHTYTYADYLTWDDGERWELWNTPYVSLRVTTELMDVHGKKNRTRPSFLSG